MSASFRRLWHGARIYWVEGPVISGAVLVVLLLIYDQYQPIFNSYEFQVITNGSVALGLAAMGETLVVLTGGFDLSVGAVMAVVNVFLAAEMNGQYLHDSLFLLAALGIGLGAGLLNGFFVAVLRLQSIIVTIASLFILSGIALVVMIEPGGSAPPGFVDALTGSFGQVPRGFLLVVVAAGLWMILRRTSFGKAIFAVGSDPTSAFISGIPLRKTLLATYALSGLLYGLAGVFLTAETASGDPRIGTSFLLTAFVAVVLGGTRFGGGYGSAIGSIIGAFIVTVIVGLLLVMGINSFYTSIVEGIVLILAVFVNSSAQRLRPTRLSVAALERGEA